jgi:signal peptidase I
MNDDRGSSDPAMTGSQGVGQHGHDADGAVGADREFPVGTGTAGTADGQAGLNDGQLSDGQAGRPDSQPGLADGQASRPSGPSGPSGPAGPPGAAGPGARPGASGARKRARRRISWWTELLALFVLALVIMLVIKTYMIQAFYIPSSSMENTLDVGDKVLVNKLVYHFRPIERGDIVVFNGEGSWDPPSPPGSSDPIVRWASQFGHAVIGLFGISPGVHDYIKRVIGVPGDHIVCCNTQGRVTVNGVPLTERSYLYRGNPPSMTRFNIRVPAGRLWVMGDHRNISYDSRGHMSDPGGGTVPENQVVGRAFMILWPPSRFRVLPIPPTFNQLNAGHALGELTTPAAPLALAAGFAVPVTWLDRRRRRRSGSGPRPKRAARGRPGRG